jgi:hypothetical protein
MKRREVHGGGGREGERKGAGEREGGRREGVM